MAVALMGPSGGAGNGIYISKYRPIDMGDINTNPTYANTFISLDVEKYKTLIIDQIYIYCYNNGCQAYVKNEDTGEILVNKSVSSATGSGANWYNITVDISNVKNLILGGYCNAGQRGRKVHFLGITIK